MAQLRRSWHRIRAQMPSPVSLSYSFFRASKRSWRAENARRLARIEDRRSARPGTLLSSDMTRRLAFSNEWCKLGKLQRLTGSRRSKQPSRTRCQAKVAMPEVVSFKQLEAVF